MKKINKSTEPPSLQNWVTRNQNKQYADLPANIRQDIRARCLMEQYYLCAYCCERIHDIDQCVNEHVEARAIAPNKSLDFSNIVASCKNTAQCDAAHGSDPIPLTPFMNECETEFEYQLSGRIKGLTERAKETIRVLNLGDTENNNRKLIEKRKQLIWSCLMTNGINPADGLEDDQLIYIFINDLNTPSNGKLESFSPVIVSILNNWIS